jgi:hypothetical protein
VGKPNPLSLFNCSIFRGKTVPWRNWAIVERQAPGRRPADGTTYQHRGATRQSCTLTLTMGFGRKLYPEETRGGGSTPGRHRMREFGGGSTRGQCTLGGSPLFLPFFARGSWPLRDLGSNDPQGAPAGCAASRWSVTPTILQGTPCGTYSERRSGDNSYLDNLCTRTRVVPRRG